MTVGGAAGSAVTPLPWKITDDLSIWTQNWPWTPVPPDGEATYTNSTCTLCPGGCGITVRKIDNRVVKIEGLAGHPVNDGGICTLGLAGPQLLYGATRIKSPMKKIDGRWQNVSWEAAITEVVERLQTLRRSGKSNQVACIAGNDRGTLPLLLSRFMAAYGSPNFMRPSTMEDAYVSLLETSQGGRGVPGFDLENADFILSFGSGILDGWGSPVRMFRANSAWKEKRAKHIQFEPRLSNTAAKASRWIPIEPGTEGLLALGIANVILREELYNRYFAESMSTGFEAWKQKVLETSPPDRISARTGVDVETIKSIGREFARAANPIAICGRGAAPNPVSLQEAAAVYGLNALVGNINRTGGIWEVPEAGHPRWPEVLPDPVAAAGIGKDRVDGARQGKFSATRYRLHYMAEALGKSGEGLQMVMVADANPLYTTSNVRALKKAFAAIPFKVSFSTYMDETAEQADLILPNHSYLERYEDVPSASGLTRPIIGLARPVIKPQFNTRHTGDVILAIAAKLGGSVASAFPWSSYGACLRESMGDKWHQMLGKGYWEDTNFRAVPWNEGFDTADGKFHFPDPGLVMGDVPEAPGTGDLVLVPADSVRIAADHIGSPPFLIKTVPDTVIKDKMGFVEINPATAAKLGLKDGSVALLSTSQGEAKVKVHLFEGIKPGVIAMERGLGHTAHDKYLADKGVNINELIGTMEDPASGLDTAWGVKARLTRA